MPDVWSEVTCKLLGCPDLDKTGYLIEAYNEGPLMLNMMPRAALGLFIGRFLSRALKHVLAFQKVVLAITQGRDAARPDMDSDILRLVELTLSQPMVLLITWKVQSAPIAEMWVDLACAVADCARVVVWHQTLLWTNVALESLPRALSFAVHWPGARDLQYKAVRLYIVALRLPSGTTIGTGTVFTPPPPLQVMMARCDACRREDASLRCGRCGAVRYCDRACQKRAWALHREFCSSDEALKPFVAMECAIERVLVTLRDLPAPSGVACRVCGGEQVPLMRGCTCRGSAGWCHVECVVAEASTNENLKGWSLCEACKQPFSGALKLELERQLWRLHRSSPDARLRAFVTRPIRVALSARGEGSADGADGDAWTEIGRATHLAASGKAAEALGIVQRAWERARRRNGDHVLDVAAGLVLVNVLAALARFEEAEPIAAQTAEAADRKLGKTHAYALRAKKSHAAALVELDRRSEAASLYESILAIETAAVGADHPSILETKAMLARATNHTRQLVPR
ncbi:hypothetical protein CTAYLR_001428 [Chrysophaeum taylorii]|uniref:MYND-type domain-containing protein n=1 Tax=Chrysophaeum taylorii TaxID=2483200 RepID=A0AAD7U9Q0_9STRA|nr:hypothetical protein CTAYLR_001428 [Chrysophaeum taylorii]